MEITQFVKRHYKNVWKTRARYLARFLPRKLSGMLLIYMIIVRPFERDNLHNFYLCSLHWHQMLDFSLNKRQQDALQQPPIKRIRIEADFLGSVAPSPLKESLSSGAAEFYRNASSVTVPRLEFSPLPVSKIDINNHDVNYDLNAHHLEYLRRFLNNKETHFRSQEQAAAIPIILHRHEDLLVVLATGEGKSLLFMLPEFMEKDKGLVTVVVVPLVALLEDMERRCTESGIAFATWKGNIANSSSVYSSSILFVTPEDLQDSKSLNRLLQQLEKDQKLARFVFDECHLFLTWS